MILLVLQDWLKSPSLSMDHEKLSFADKRAVCQEGSQANLHSKALSVSKQAGK